MKQLHPVFNVVKLTPAPDDPIPGRKTTDHPPPIIINGEAEWEVEEILDSRWHRRRFQYLIKWKGYVMNIEWDYSYYQPWSDNEWLVDEMIAMQEEALMAQNENITMQ